MNNFIEKIRKSEKKILSHKKIEEQQNIGSSSHSIPLIHQLTRSMQHANDAMIKFMAANQGNAEMEEAFLLTHLFLPDTLSQDTSLPEFCYDYEDKKKDVDRSPDSI